MAQLIIEKIIESGDPFKQSEILEYLFNALSSKEKIEKRKEILFLLIELYGGNMMPPKYYELYYKSLLLNGSLFYSPKKRLLAKRRTDIKYDENELSNVYCQIVTETTTFQKTVESLLYLNHEFRKITLEKFYDKILLENTFKLFSYYIEPKRDLDEKESDNIKDVIYYFLNKRYDILQGSPLLLICLIELIYSYDLYNCIDYEKLLFLDIEPNEYFYNYSRGATLIALSNNSIENDHSFALLLLMLNVCSYKGANIIIGYALKTCRLNVENLPEIRSFIYWIWEVLNSSKDCQIFKNKIMEKGLYNEKYEMIYDQTYAAYQKSELDVTDYRIKDYIEANKKNI